MRDYKTSFFHRSTLIRIAVGAIFAFFWFALLIDSWFTNYTQIGAHILLAFLSAISLAQASYHLRERELSN